MKTCNKCNKIKEIDDFYRDKRSPNGSRRPICRKCHSSYTLSKRSPYRVHKKAYCEHCNFIALDPCQLDVDHIDGNHSNNDSSNLQTLCANCHRIKTKLNRDNSNE